MNVTYSRYKHVEIERVLRLIEVMKSISHELYFKIIGINRIEFDELLLLGLNDGTMV